MVLFFAVLMVLGVLVLGIGIISYFDTGSAKVWLTTTGTVTDSNISTEWVGGPPCCGGLCIYFPNITYEFQVDEVKYTGHKISASSSGSPDISYAQSILNTYSLGKNVTVYYSPSNPSDSVLQIEGALEYVPMIFGLVFALIGMGGIVYVWRSKRFQSGN